MKLVTTHPIHGANIKIYAETKGKKTARVVIDIASEQSSEREALLVIAENLTRMAEDCTKIAGSLKEFKTNSFKSLDDRRKEFVDAHKPPPVTPQDETDGFGDPYSSGID